MESERTADTTVFFFFFASGGLTLDEDVFLFLMTVFQFGERCERVVFFLLDRFG